MSGRHLAAASVVLLAGWADNASVAATMRKHASAVDTTAAIARDVRDRALHDSTAFTLIESLTTEVGARQTGTAAAALARNWGIAQFKALGFGNVHAEQFSAGAWLRGAESAVVTAPYTHTLQVLGLGRSVPTPAGGIEADVALFHSYDDLLAAPAGSLAGKIAVVTQPMVRTQDGSGYGAINAARTRGAVEAARRGAIGYLVRSLSTSMSRLPHAGAMRYAEDVAKIPAAAIAVPDALMLEQLFARGAPVRIRLTLASTSLQDVPAWNVVGEIRGSTRPNEIVLIGGHLDSWDPGTGAIDDGAGVAITTAAGKLIGDLQQRPARTLRVVMFGAEEMDYSGAAYATAHKNDMASMVLTSESDAGADNVWSVQLPTGLATQPVAKTIASVLAPLSIFVSPEPAKRGGSDVAGLVEGGVPVISFRQDASRYFDWHHSADDTLDKIDRPQLNQNVSAWVATLYLLLDSDVDFRALGQMPTAAPGH